MLIFCYHTDDEKLIDLVHRYWATDKNGKHLESSTSLFSLTGAKHASQQTEILSNIATAYITNSRCNHCNKPQQIKSRSSCITNHNFDCKECLKSIKEHQKKIEDERSKIEKQELSELLSKAIERNKKLTADYQSINDDLAIITLALNHSLGNRLFEIKFNLKHCGNLSPMNSANYIARLLRSGLITTNPEYSAPGAYFVKNDGLWHYSNLVTYECIPDKIIKSGQDIINILQNRPFNQGEALRSLWIEYATNDCMLYTLNFSSLHGLDIAEDEKIEIENIIRSALNTYSISNLWSMVWMIVKDAAALSTREYYNKRKATATLPGKLKRHLEDIRKGKRDLRNWERPADQASSSLGEIFYKIWMIDENTPGTELENIFPTIKKDTKVNELCINREFVTETLVKTIDQDLAPEMLTMFANSIKEGKSLMESLEIVYSLISQ